MKSFGLVEESKKGVFSNYSSSLATPKLIKLAPNLTVVLFELMKLIPAKHTLLKALNEGKIDPDVPIIETSSGTYAHGMAIVCAELNQPFIIISDPIIDDHLKNRLTELGGEVQIISSSSDSLNVQTLRLQTLNDYLIENPRSFWPAQYDNPENRKSYYPFAELLLETMGDSFTLVGAVGSGGSTSGTMERLRMENENIGLIGVDTFGSVLFGLKAGKRKLRGLGNSLLPKNLIHSYFDQVHWLSAECAYQSSRTLHNSTGLYCGPTTGAAFHVAMWYAQKHPEEEVVFIAPDSGHRYTQTVYSDLWLKGEGLNISQDFSAPFQVTNLSEVREPWSFFNWDRKTYKEVIDHYG